MRKICKFYLVILLCAGICLCSFVRTAVSDSDTHAKTVEGITLVDRVEFEKTYKKHWEDATPRERQKFIKKKKRRKKKKAVIGKQTHENVEITNYESFKKKKIFNPNFKIIMIKII